MFRFAILWTITIFFCAPAYAQKIVEAEIGINGLTCSQCSRSVELSLRRLRFIKDVSMDLEHTKGRLFFKDNEKIDPDAIAQAVKNAGFSVRSLDVVFMLNDKLQPPCFNANGFSYQVVRSPQVLQGRVELQVLGNSFLPKKEFKTWQPLLKNSCNTKGKLFFAAIKTGKA
jgi:copper chaperone CopZ